MRGRAKAIVLPLPVRPRPRTSRPVSESGSVTVWMGKGEVMPWSRRASMSRLGTPTLANDASAEGRVDVRVELMVMPFVKIEVRRPRAKQGWHAVGRGMN